METTADQNKKMAILSLTFGNRMKIAWQLTKPRLIPYFLFFMVLGVACMFAMGVPIFLMDALSPVFAILLPFPLLALLFVSVGFYSSILRFMEGQEAHFEIRTFFEPFQRWKTLLPTLLIFGLVYVTIQLVLGLFSLIPILGGIINILATIIMTIATACYFFYIAEHKNAPMGKLLSTPPSLIFPHMSRWMGAIGGSLLAYLPLFVFTIIFVVILAVSDSSIFDELRYGYDYDYDYYGYESGGMTVAAILGLILIGLFVCFCGFIAYIFSSFLFAIAYKQSLIAQELMPPKAADPFAQPNHAANNPFGQNNQFAQADQFAQTNQFAQGDQFAQNNQASAPGQTWQASPASQVNQASQAHLASQVNLAHLANQAHQAEQAGQPTQPTQPTQPNQLNQPGQPGQPGQYEPPNQQN